MIKKLKEIQSELKAPKGQYNSFGKYKYRSCEDILEAVKPVLAKHGCSLTISDSIELIGDRYYVRATATLLDADSNNEISVSAYARESLDKKGMDSSQVTGAASSYARKYALNGLFCIDDTKEMDTDEARNQSEAKESRRGAKNTLSKKEMIDKATALCDVKNIPIEQICSMGKVEKIQDMTIERLEGVIEWVSKQ